MDSTFPSKIDKQIIYYICTNLLSIGATLENNKADPSFVH